MFAKLRAIDKRKETGKKLFILKANLIPWHFLFVVLWKFNEHLRNTTN